MYKWKDDMKHPGYEHSATTPRAHHRAAEDSHTPRQYVDFAMALPSTYSVTSCRQAKMEVWYESEATEGILSASLSYQ